MNSDKLKKDTSSNNILPTFLIIGAQKCGTTTLFENMMKHPNIVRTSRKEVAYFSWNFNKGIEWYKKIFPMVSDQSTVITGEATTNYIWHPLTPKRVKKILPNAKIIIILRNPIDRAYSQYQMSFSKGKETLSFEDAIKCEEDRLRGERNKIISNENFDSFEYRYHSYLTRGKYVYQIKEWMKYFPRDQFLVLLTNDLAEKSDEVYKKVFRFLDLSQLEMNYDYACKGNYQEMNLSTRKMLIKYFKPYNENLRQFLKIDIDWDK